MKRTDFSRVIVTGDVLRPVATAKRSSQTVNIQWINHLLRWQLQQATGVAPEILCWGPGGFDTEGFYALARHRLSIQGWAALSASTDVPRAALEYVRACFDGAVVISFENNPLLRRCLAALDIPYVDMVTHPARFMDDIFFGFATNVPAIFDRLKAKRIPEGLLYAQAGLLQAGLARLSPTLPADVDVLLAGQMPDDRSVIAKGRLVNFGHFREEVRSLWRGSNRIALKMHPYNRSDFGLYATGLPLHATMPTRENFYRLLSEPGLKRVCSVSSSTCYEARYFGKEHAYFYKPPFRLVESNVEEHCPDAYVGVMNGFLATDFWRDLLHPVAPTTPCDGVEPPRPPNQLRMSLRHFWGYNQVTTDLLVDAYNEGRNA